MHSSILKPDIEPREVAKITLVAAVAVAASLREVTGVQAMIKWPNDIIIKGKKACGILTEMKAEQDKVDFLIVGIGVNVDTPAGSLPKGATSIAKESGSKPSKVKLAKRLLAIRKPLSVILCTGYSKTITPEQANAEGIKAFVYKPISKKEIARKIREVLGEKT